MMKTTTFALLLIAISLPVTAQRPRGPRASGTFLRTDAAEAAVKQAAEELALIKKRVDKDIEVLAHIRAADQALTDNMQPSIAVQKAYEEIAAAQRLQPDFVVEQGVIKVERELESARLSPTTADFGHLRAVIRNDALGPASRVVVREATGLTEQTAAWIRVQQQISDHLRALSDIASESLRATASDQ